MKLLLLQHNSIQHFGFMYMSSCLKKYNHECVLLKYDKKIFETIDNLKPDIIGFYMIETTYDVIIKIICRIKKRCNIPIIVGGPFVTIKPNIIKHPGIDYLCRGESEQAIVELMNTLEAQEDVTDIQNIWTTKGGKIFRNPTTYSTTDLNKLPYPDRNLYTFNVPAKNMCIVVSRGCDFACSYCSNPIFKRIYDSNISYVRRRSPDNVIDEIIALKQTQMFSHVFFIDDVFISDEKWLSEFSRLYSDRIGLPFQCNISLINITPTAVKLLANSGCKRIFFGLETGNERIRKYLLNKKISNKEIKKKVALIKSYGINIGTYNMLGLPKEDLSGAISTIQFNADLNVDYTSFSMFIPFTGLNLSQYYDNKNEKEYSFMCSLGPLAVRFSVLRKLLPHFIQNIKLYRPLLFTLTNIYNAISFLKVFKNENICSYLVKNPLLSLTELSQILNETSE